MPFGKAAEGNDETHNEYDESLLKKLSECSPGMVAHHLAKARDFLETYLDFLDIERHKITNVSFPTSDHSNNPGTKKLQPFNYIPGSASHLIGLCYENNTEVTIDTLGLNLRGAAGRTLHTIKSLMTAAKGAQLTFLLTKAPEEQADILNVENAETLFKELYLTLMYCGYVMNLKEGQSQNADPRIRATLKSPKFQGQHSSLIQIVRNSILKHIERQDMFDTALMAMKVPEEHKETIMEILEEHSFVSAIHKSTKDNAPWLKGIEAAKQLVAQKAEPGQENTPS